MSAGGVSSFAASRGTPRPRWLAPAVGALALFVLGLLVGAALFGGDGETTQTTTDAPIASAGEPGPRRVVKGVPVGYARTEAGAVAAATAYVTALSGEALLDERRIRTVLEVIAARDVLSELARAYQQGARLTRERLGIGGAAQPTVVFRESALGYRVDRFSADEATISIWTIGVAGSSAAAPPQQSWSTTEVRLRWARDWKVEGLRSRSGPTPSLAGAVSPGSQLFKEISEFEVYRRSELS